MDKKRWKKLSHIFDLALTLPQDRRTIYIKNLCPDDRRLQKEINELLASVEASDQLLEQHLRKNEDLLYDITAHLKQSKGSYSLEGTTLGQWEIVELLACGGMGDVYKARRIGSDIQQEGALKIMRRGLNTPENIRRFRLEKQILAGLHHPNIARLIEGGLSDDDLPYLVMEYVDGIPITQYCDEHRLTINERLTLFKVVCNAVQHAHKNLIVHRDLKPENILVNKEGRVKILDFGIAKLLDPDLYEFSTAETQRGMRLMSLDYAAPEQVSGEAISTATDLYALGILLFELLTGVLPFDFEDKSYQTITQMIQFEEPPSPSQRVKHLSDPKGAAEKAGFRSIRPGKLIKTLRGDLDAIILKALRKEPDARYNSANQLKDDIAFYLQDKPVLAREKAVKYRVRKFMRRHKLGVAAAVMVLISLIGGLGMALWQSERARAALEETEIALNRTQAVQDFMLDLFRSAEPNRPRDQLPGTEEILKLGAERALDPESAGAPERFAMLHTLANIYLAQNFVDQARPLITETVELARDHRLDRPEDFAKALQQQAWLAFRERNFDTADTLFQEAEEWLSEYPEYEDTALEIRANRGLLQIHKRNIPQALAFLQPLYEKISNNPDMSNDLRYQIINPLRTAYSMNEDLDSVQKLEEELKPIVMDLDGPESRGYAIFLANSAGTKRELGRFEAAESDLNQAIALYNKIFDTDKPAEYRAAARHQLARVFLYRGEFERAIEEFNKSNTEWASSIDLKPEDFPYTHLAQTRVLARAKRWDKSAEMANRALNVMRSDSTYIDSEAMVFAKALLSWSICKQNGNFVGKNHLENALTRLAGLEVNTAEYQAQLHEARAECLLKLDRPQEALLQINGSLDAIATPGRVIEITDRRLLRSQILAALGRDQDAKQELKKAEQLFIDLDLTDHPHFSQIHTTLQELAFK